MSKKIFITGVSGLLGSSLAAYFSKNNKIYGQYKNHKMIIDNIELYEIELLDKVLLENKISTIEPEIIIHCAGLTNVDECEKKPDYAHKIHVDVSKILAHYSYKKKIKFVHISTDHLWDGTKSLISESEPYSPLNIYGRTKAEAEESVLIANPDALIIRTNFFGNGLNWRKSFSDFIVENLKKKNTFNGFEDVFFTPISLPFLSEYISELINLDSRGIFNLLGSERISKYEFARKIAGLIGVSDNFIKPISIDKLNLMAKRPKDMSLSTEKISKYFGKSMPDIDESLRTIII